jgi:hypothetical protein
MAGICRTQSVIQGAEECLVGLQDGQLLGDPLGEALGKISQ